MWMHNTYNGTVALDLKWRNRTTHGFFVNLSTQSVPSLWTCLCVCVECQFGIDAFASCRA
eukprot:m.1186423 g.1186423  ORF g.1186423 m.1186423 type:complete len:60 (+) comp24547_c0_seq1:339-518(+)